MNQPVKPMEFKFTEDSIIKGHYHSVMPERVWKDLDQDFHNRAIHVIEKSYADKLQAELAKKDELLRECEKALEHYANKRISEGGTARAYFEKWKKDAKT